MIKTNSDDPDVAVAAAETLTIITEVLAKLPKAQRFDYGGHMLEIGEYDVCTHCSTPIAEAQAAQATIQDCIELSDDELIKEHLQLAADLFALDAQAAIKRAELHNGVGTEAILNQVLGYEYERGIGDDYQHSHHKGD